MSEILIEDFLNINNSDIQVIDIREQYEYENGHIDSMHIPMSEVFQSIKKIKSNKKVIIYCQTGRRAAAVVYMLQKNYNLNNVFNLIGGYDAYINFNTKT